MKYAWNTYNVEKMHDWQKDKAIIVQTRVFIVKHYCSTRNNFLQKLKFPETSCRVV